MDRESLALHRDVHEMQGQTIQALAAITDVLADLKNRVTVLEDSIRGLQDRVWGED